MFEHISKHLEISSKNFVFQLQFSVFGNVTHITEHCISPTRWSKSEHAPNKQHWLEVGLTDSFAFSAMAGNSTLYLLFDFLAALTILFLEIALHASIYGTQSGLWPHKKGFFCDDKSIQMPYKEDTISWTTVLCVGFIATIVTVSLSEE